ncbi:MAG: helix-turn-helix transcriptional regulator [Victivallales bacterium]|nr:helix-turn-helix transcriptional regulator [Victivallales bacterium]
MNTNQKQALFRSPVLPSQCRDWSPYLRLAHDFAVDSGNRLFAKESLGDHALHYFYQGDGSYELEGQVHAIVPHSVFLVRPGTGYRFQLTPGAEVRMYNLHFDLVEIAASHCMFPCPVADAPLKVCLPDNLPSFQHLAGYSTYEQLFSQLLDAAGRSGESTHLHSKGLLLELIALLYSSAGKEGRQATIWTEHNAAVERVLHRLQVEPGYSYSLDELAKIAGVSRSLFCRIFRTATGMTPQHYLNRFRLEQASRDLLFTSMQIKEIAERYGFASVHHFTRKFSAFIGEPPAVFRRLHKNTLSDK